MRHIVIALLALAASQTRLDTGDGARSTKTSGMRSHAWLATCKTWRPTTGARVVATPRVRRILVHGRWIIMRRVHDTLWAVTAPRSARSVVQAAGCVVADYASADAETRETLRARGGVCCGRMTWRGRVYRSWPCYWSRTRAIVVDHVTDVGPAVVAGHPACPAVDTSGS